MNEAEIGRKTLFKKNLTHLRACPIGITGCNKPSHFTPIMLAPPLCKSALGVKSSRRPHHAHSLVFENGKASEDQTKQKYWLEWEKLSAVCQEPLYLWQETDAIHYVLAPLSPTPVICHTVMLSTSMGTKQQNELNVITPEAIRKAHSSAKYPWFHNICQVA